MYEKIKQGNEAVLIQKEHLSNLKTFFALKRMGDICMAIGLFLLSFPIMCIISIFIKMDSPGPVLFSQERLGKNGKPFLIYKFRSMKIDAEKDGPQWATEDDNRCTRVGKILRKSRLDELPQLWNILDGDMSFVGPRPEREYFYKEFERYIPGFKNRLIVKPGLTGLAQVNGGYDLKPEEKILYDMEYIENQSIFLDIKCILQTVKLVFTHKGAR